MSIISVFYFETDERKFIMSDTPAGLPPWFPPNKRGFHNRDERTGIGHMAEYRRERGRFTGKPRDAKAQVQEHKFVR